MNRGVNALSRLLCAAAAVVHAADAPPPRVVLADGRLEVRAQGNRLSEVLAGFRHYGIEVNFDPGAEATVSGEIPRQPVDDALRVLLAEAGFVTRWNMVPTPAGPEPALAGIDVFRRGDRRGLAPLAGGGPFRFSVIRDDQGREYIRDEILLGVKEAMPADEFRKLVALVNGYVVGAEKELGVYRIKLPPGSSVPLALEILRRNPAVAAVEPNYAHRLPGGQGGATPSAGATNPAAGQPVKGEPPVAVLDSGLMDGLDLGQWVVGRFDATRPGTPLADPNGHGSQMALIATGAVQPAGVRIAAETGVPVLAVKAFDDAGVASSFSVIESLRYARDQGARVASLSWGSSQDSGFLRGALLDAVDGGMVVLAAAGNEPTGQPVYPAAYPGVLAIGALDANGERWDKSNFGDFLTATAPGFADFPVGHEGPPGPYAGTSISTPWVARSFSRYFGANPSATATQATQAFVGSLRDAGAPGPDPYYGNGVFDRAAEARFLSGVPVGNP